MIKTIVFDLGGTLMEYSGMPDDLFRSSILKMIEKFYLQGMKKKIIKKLKMPAVNLCILMIFWKNSVIKCDL